MKGALLFCLSIVLFGCAEPIEFEIDRTELIVVDGKIATRKGESYIKIYKSSNKNKREDLNGYDIKVITGSEEEIVFTESNFPGRYIPESPFQGVIGEKYRMEAISPEGFEIVSSYDLIMSPAPYKIEVLDTVEQELSNAGILLTNEIKAVFVTVDTKGRDLYQSKFTFEYQYRHEFTLDTLSETILDEFTLFSCENASQCQNEFGQLAAKQADREWFFFNPECGEITPDCPTNCCYRVPDWITVFVMTQEVMTPQTFRFWQKIERLLVNDGLIFDTFPFPLEGNVSCENCDIPVVGNLSAVSVNSEKSIVWL